MNVYTTSGGYLFATQPPSEPERSRFESGRGYILKIYLDTQAQPIFRIPVELLVEGAEYDEVRDVVIPALLLAADPARWNDPELQEHGQLILDAAYTNLLIRRWLPERN